MSKRKKDMFDFVMDNMALNIGVAAGAGIVGKTTELMPSPVSSNIMRGMGTMSIIPTVHATGGVFGQLSVMDRMIKKKKR